MKITYKKTLIALALLSTTLQGKTGDIYAGLEWYGISGKYDVTDKVTAQAIFGAWGYNNLTSITGRGIYKFKQKDYYDLYAFGAGAGMEYDIRGLDNTLPAIYLNADIGLQYANFSYYGGFSGLGIGLGIHYKF